ncbi:FecR family protein [Alistipes provencensis]|uniref:FecR family protein n=1 Tax=Alistipes provencensis TaxID=1816676 RepID=UPI0007ED248C|nr:FecR domain-containing protein [Alistipes provencensis]
MEKYFEELIIDYLTGNLSDSEATRFLEFVHSDEQHRRRFEELSRLYAQSLIPRFEADKKIRYREVEQRIAASRRMLTPWRIPSWMRVAAALVAGIVLGAASLFVLRPDVDPGLCEVTAPAGTRSQIMLPDSSLVWLNAGSKLIYAGDFGRKSRQVRLEGEGYFEVTRNAGCPFTVRTDVLDITVLGTSFNVQAYADARTVEVDLLKGSVEVAAADGRRLSLLPDQQARFDRASGLFESHPAVTTLAADWVNGRLSFINTPFPEILEKLQRHFNIRIEVRSEKAARESFSGSIDLRLSLDEILRYIDVDRKYVWTTTDGTLRLTDRN